MPIAAIEEPRSCSTISAQPVGSLLTEEHRSSAWQGDPVAAPILIAAARYLAAHSPTPRARYQTAQVARRLMRGGAVHVDGSEAEGGG